jgi:hypothetical protein
MINASAGSLPCYPAFVRFAIFPREKQGFPDTPKGEEKFRSLFGV